MDEELAVVDDADAVRDQAASQTADPHGEYDPSQPFAGSGYLIDRERGITKITVTTHDGAKTSTIPVAIDPVARVREDGVVVGLWVHLIDKDGRRREVFIRTEDMGGRDPYGKLLRATGYAFTEGDAWDAQLKYVKKLLIKATTHRGIRAMDTLAQPRWDGDRLRVPGITDTPSPDTQNGILTQHYGPPVENWATLDAGDGAAAREAWRQIIAYGAKHPKLGLVIGMALLSAFLARMNVRGTTVHIGGMSTYGKTQGAEIATCAIGNPRDNEVLAGTWDATYVGIMARLKATGGLPYLLDETSLAVGQYEQNLERVPYAVWSGKERGRGNVDGDARDQSRFTLNLISTGEQDLADSMGGAYARVVQLNAPLIEGEGAAGISEMLHALALQYYGWPLRWLVLSGWAPTEASLTDIPEFDNPVAQRHARSLAAAKLAFDRVAVGLFKESGQPAPKLNLLAATKEMVEGITENASSADRLYEELWTDANAQSHRYYMGEAGRDLGETWVVTPDRVRAVALRIGINDIRPVIRGMVAQGYVIPQGDRGNRTRKALREGEPVVTVYEFAKPPDAGDLSQGAEQDTATGHQDEVGESA